MSDRKEYPSDQEARKQILDIGRRMYEKGFVASNDGNISCKVAEREIWVTPTGVSKGFMEEDMLVKLNLEGDVLEGSCKPSSEIMMHLRCYTENPEIGAVVHAHPPYGTAFACAGLPLDSRILPEGIVQLGVVPCAKFGMPGTEEVPDSIAPYVQDYNAVLLGNHGALTWGETLQQGYMRMESLEFYAREIMYTRYILKSELKFTENEIDRLIQIRNSLGIRQGGRPT